MKERLFSLLACFFLSMGFTWAQTSTVTGVVISAEDDEPVVGASVLVKGTTMGSITDIDGRYTITAVPSDAKTLVVSLVGMKTQEVGIKKGTQRIVMEPDSKLVDEVLVVAYGTTKRSAFTGSAVVLDKDKINTPAASADKSLAGQLAGVQVLSNSGQPGSATTFRVRGSGSLNASNEPLIVVDGVATTNMEYSQIAENAESSSNVLSSLNSNDIPVFGKF